MAKTKKKAKEIINVTPGIISRALDEHVTAIVKKWGHDRSKSVGASEVGGCIRQTWYSKHGMKPDESYVDRWGARHRGVLTEAHLFVPAIREFAAAHGMKIFHTGENQRTFHSGQLSATPDGILQPADSLELIVLDCKSIDPRIKITEPKPQHVAQVMAGMGVIRDNAGANAKNIRRAIIAYIDSSWSDDVHEFEVIFNHAVYEQLQERARRVFSTDNPFDMLPEGKMGGGDECKYCRFAKTCLGTTVAAIPQTTAIRVPEDAALLLHALATEAARHKHDMEVSHTRVQIIREGIKHVLQQYDTKGVKQPEFTVSWTTVKGRPSYDMPAIKEALEAAHIDIAKLSKVGDSTDRLTVKVTTPASNPQQIVESLIATLPPAMVIEGELAEDAP